MSFFNIIHIEEMCHRGTIKESDIEALRAVISGQAALDQSSMDDLFRIHALCHLKPVAWSDLFIDAVTEFLVNEAQPIGYLTADQVRYLMERLERNGRLETRTEFDLILNIIATARWAPESLAATALNAVLAAIELGKGVARGNYESMPATLSSRDVALIRAILMDFGGDERRPLTRTELEVLIHIDECIGQGLRSTDWIELYVKAVANAILAASGYAVPVRSIALSNCVGDAQNASEGQGLSQEIDRTIATYVLQTAEERSIQRLEKQRIEIVTGDRVREADGIWIWERLEHQFAKNSHLSKLLAHLKSRGLELHPALTKSGATSGQVA